MSIERACTDKDVEKSKEGVRDKDRQEDREEVDTLWSYTVIKEICSFRPACVSAEAFALQQNATVGWRG